MEVGTQHRGWGEHRLATLHKAKELKPTEWMALQVHCTPDNWQAEWTALTASTSANTSTSISTSLPATSYARAVHLRHQRQRRHCSMQQYHRDARSDHRTAVLLRWSECLVECLQ